MRYREGAHIQCWKLYISNKTRHIPIGDQWYLCWKINNWFILERYERGPRHNGPTAVPTIKSDCPNAATWVDELNCFWIKNWIDRYAVDVINLRNKPPSFKENLYMNAWNVHKMNNTLHFFQVGQFRGWARCSSVARARTSSPCTDPTSEEVSFPLKCALGDGIFLSSKLPFVTLAIVSGRQQKRKLK